MIQVATSSCFSSIVSSSKLSISSFCSSEANWHRLLSILISIGMTASNPYAKQNGVALIEVFAVVLLDHKTPGSSSAHLPFACSSCFLSVLNNVLFVDSAWLFDWGFLGEAKVSLMFHLAHKS